MLKCQKGNCFDFSTLLCSMLIGAGYDAYCVNGYGSLDLCHMDLTREVCPLTTKPKEVWLGSCCPRHPTRHAILEAMCPCFSCPCRPSPRLYHETALQLPWSSFQTAGDFSVLSIFTHTARFSKLAVPPALSYSVSAAVNPTR